MVRYVVDASIVVKWFVEEDYSEKALDLEKRYVEGSIDLIAPCILNFEVLNALKFSHHFGEEELVEVAKALTKYQFDLRELQGEIATKTIIIAMRKGITIYDAAYVAIAEIEGVHLITADEKLINKVKETQLIKHIADL